MDPMTRIPRLLEQVKPVLLQLLKSHYVFVFQLPSPLPELWIRCADYKLLDGLLGSADELKRYKAAFLDKERVTASINYYRGGGFFRGWRFKGQEEEEAGKIGYPTLILWVTFPFLLDLFTDSFNLHVLLFSRVRMT